MALFLSQEWVDDFNTAVREAQVTIPPGVSLAAEGGHVGVLQEVHRVPHAAIDDGIVKTRLTIESGVVTLALVDAVDAVDADVTVALDYEDAAAMSQGVLDPAQALGDGRIQVRGDLSVLVAAQSVLAAAEQQLSELRDLTTY